MLRQNGKRPRAYYLSGLFLGLFLGVSFLCAGAAVWKTRHSAIPQNTKTLFSGSWASLYEKRFNKELPSHALSKNSWTALTYTLFREGRDGVLVGSDGWLFTAEEFAYPPQQADNFQQNIQFIRSISDTLKQAGIELVIVPVPAKARIYADKLGRYDYPSYQQSVYNRFAKAMRGYEIDFIDTVPALNAARKSRNVFLKTDTHWTPDGAHITARNTADYIKKSLGAALPEPVPYKITATGSIRYTGDLLRYLPLGKLAHRLGLQTETVTGIQVIAANNGQTATLQQALFSSAAPPVTLVGTSYSANPAWSFAGFLKQALQSDILNAADEGLGPFATMENYLADEAFKASPPRLVIWEIPERYLSFAYERKAV